MWTGRDRPWLTGGLMGGENIWPNNDVAPEVSAGQPGLAIRSNR